MNTDFDFSLDDDFNDGVTIPIPEAAHRHAIAFAKRQLDSKRGKRVYLNILAIYAVYTYLSRTKTISVDLKGSYSWQLFNQTFLNQQDLYLPAIGRIECCPVFMGEDSFDLPPLSDDSIVCIAVLFKEELSTATLLGYYPVFPETEATLNTRILLSFDNIADYLFKIQDALKLLWESSSLDILALHNQLYQENYSPASLVAKVFHLFQRSHKKMGMDSLSTLKAANKLVIDSGIFKIKDSLRKESLITLQKNQQGFRKEIDLLFPEDLSNSDSNLMRVRERITQGLTSQLYQVWNNGFPEIERIANWVKGDSNFLWKNRDELLSLSPAYRLNTKQEDCQVEKAIRIDYFSAILSIGIRSFDANSTVQIEIALYPDQTHKGLSEGTTLQVLFDPDMFRQIISTIDDQCIRFPPLILDSGDRLKIRVARENYYFSQEFVC